MNIITKIEEFLNESDDLKSMSPLQILQHIKQAYTGDTLGLENHTIDVLNRKIRRAKSKGDTELLQKLTFAKRGISSYGAHSMAHIHRVNHDDFTRKTQHQLDMDKRMKEANQKEKMEKAKRKMLKDQKEN